MIPIGHKKRSGTPPNRTSIEQPIAYINKKFKFYVSQLKTNPNQTKPKTKPKTKNPKGLK